MTGPLPIRERASDTQSLRLGLEHDLDPLPARCAHENRANMPIAVSAAGREFADRPNGVCPVPRRVRSSARKSRATTATAGYFADSQVLVRMSWVAFNHALGANRLRRALLRLFVAAAVVLVLHSVTRFSPWLLVGIGAAAALLLLVQAYGVARLRFLARVQREDWLALWIGLVCLTVIGYLHNSNSWGLDGKGFLRAGDVSLWKTEMVLGVALAVPLIHTLLRVVRPEADPVAGRQFAREFALYINFSGIALALWSGDALLTQSVVVTLFAWVALAELTLYASD